MTNTGSFEQFMENEYYEKEMCMELKNFAPE